MALFYRSYYAIGDLRTQRGEPISAVYGAATFLSRLVAEHRPDYLLVASDSNAKTFRHAMFPAYKGTRKKMEPDQVSQLPLFYKLFDAMGVRVIREDGMEADDLIGTAAQRFGFGETHVYIVSGDKDFMQLLGPNVSLMLPKKGTEAVLVGPHEAQARFGGSVVDALALMGDATDNVPGVAGIGEKGAATLVSTYGTLEAIYRDGIDGGAITAKKLRENLIRDREAAFLSRTLVTIKTDCELGFELSDLATSPSQLGNQGLVDFYESLDFKALADEARAKLKQSGPKDSSTHGAMHPAAPVTGDAFHPSEEAAGGVQTRTYTLVDTHEALAAMLADLHGAAVVAFDTETTGLSVVDDRPIGISLSADPGEAYYVPLGPTGEVPEALMSFLTSGHPERTLVAHNAKFDLQMLKNIDVTLTGIIDCTMVMDTLLNPEERQHGLDHLVLKYFNFRKIPTTALMGEDKSTPMSSVPMGQLTEYACEDADYTLRLYQLLSSRLKEVTPVGYPWLVTRPLATLHDVYSTVERPLLPLVAQMEQTGILLDAGAMTLLGETLGAKETKLKETLFGLAGHTFNPASPKQLGHILYEVLKVHEATGAKRLKKTKTGLSTDEATLSKMAQHPFVATLLALRHVAKLLGTYVEPLPRLISKKTARLHASFSQVGAATGRMSSSGPNLQNIPARGEDGRRIRAAFRAPPGMLLCSADYSQIELRVLAHLSGDSALQADLSGGEDVHRATAAKVFGVEASAVTPAQRDQAKGINYAIVYGSGAKGLSATLGVSTAEAAAFIERYMGCYPGVKAYQEAVVGYAVANRRTETLLGRVRPAGEVDAKNEGIASLARNAAINAPIQGSAADLIKLAAVATEEAAHRAGLPLRMLAIVHDELLMEVPTERAEEAKALVKRAMEGVMPSLAVPLVANVSTGESWAEAHA